MDHRICHSGSVHVSTRHPHPPSTRHFVAMGLFDPFKRQTH